MSSRFRDRAVSRLAMKMLVSCLAIQATMCVADPEEKGQAGYLKVVRAYADAMLEHGRDRYGEESSPLFATTLDRRTMQLFQGEELEKIRSIPREGWDIRNHDRMVMGANPMHHENFYQVLYALSEATEDKRYANEANAALKWFFEHGQSETTGLMAWGEHIGWDFVEEKAVGGPHEFFRPWVLWERCYELAPKSCARFAKGLWEHQIGDHETGNFSRHADYWTHRPGKNSEYPRHGGFYIATWAAAYQHTKDPLFLTAIETVVDYFNKRRSPLSDAIPCESAERSKGKRVWPSSNLSLAVDLWDASGKVPDPLAEKMRKSASRTDKVYLAIEHDLAREDKGFVGACHTDTLEVEGYSKGVWGAGYGNGGDAQMANLCMLRFRQVHLDGYKRLVLHAGDRYLGDEPSRTEVLHPAPLGDAIFLMLACHEISGDGKYLEEADRFAHLAIDLFVKEGGPLPAATTVHPHYEAITRGDTLMMALLKLWQRKNRPDLSVRLVYTDR